MEEVEQGCTFWASPRGAIESPPPPSTPSESPSPQPPAAPNAHLEHVGGVLTCEEEQRGRLGGELVRDGPFCARATKSLGTTRLTRDKRVVDAHDLHIAALQARARDQAADAARAVDTDLVSRLVLARLGS